VNIALEEQTGLAGKDAVGGIKTGLMGPLAGIGDTLFFVIPTTIIGSVASYLALQGTRWGLFSGYCSPWFACCLCALASAKGIRKGSTCWGL
jgi:PTS system mannose-specific IID component